MATPFLVCRNMPLIPVEVMTHSDDAAMSEHCAAMMMSVSGTEHGGESMEADNVATMNADGAFSASSQHCEYLCQFARGLNSFDASESLIVVSLMLARDGDLYHSRFVSPPLEVHFRPPINS